MLIPASSHPRRSASGGLPQPCLLCRLVSCSVLSSSVFMPGFPRGSGRSRQAASSPLLALCPQLMLAQSRWPSWEGAGRVRWMEACSSESPEQGSDTAGLTYRHTRTSPPDACRALHGIPRQATHPPPAAASVSAQDPLGQPPLEQPP